MDMLLKSSLQILNPKQDGKQVFYVNNDLIRILETWLLKACNKLPNIFVYDSFGMA